MASEARQTTDKGGVTQLGTGKEPAKLQALKRGDASLFEINHNTWRVIVKENDATPASLDLHPTFWNALSDGNDGAKEGDEISALWNSGKHFARYIVVGAQHGALAVRLAYAVEGAPLISTVGPRAFPAGYHIDKARHDEGGGFVVVRERDGMRIMSSGGMPWRTHQDAYEQFLKSAIFRSEDVTRYLP